MARVERTSDIVEIHWTDALFYGVGGLAGIGGFVFLFYYRGEGTLLNLAYVMLIAGVISLGYGLRRAISVRHITAVAYTCPYCEGITELTEIAKGDYSCVECNRMVPIVDGEVIPVHLVRCGYCNELNYYSEKTEFLVCEKCNHEIPIHGDEQGSGKAVPKYYAITEDESLYELVLLAYSAGKSEELINCLQHMLALNRNQVKNMLQDLPVTLLTGITRRKAEMLQAQLGIHDGASEARSLV
jgi:hypothetical protein